MYALPWPLRALSLPRPKRPGQSRRLGVGVLAAEPSLSHSHRTLGRPCCPAPRERSGWLRVRARRLWPPSPSREPVLTAAGGSSDCAGRPLPDECWPSAPAPRPAADAALTLRWIGLLLGRRDASSDARRGRFVAAAAVSTAAAAAFAAANVAAAEEAPAGTDVTTPEFAKRPNVLFVLGGPGAGKGTQCERLVKECGFVHLSAGDLLRAERKSGSAHGDLIAKYILDGRIVPVEITVSLLAKAMAESGRTRFLIDGFPRNENNFEGWKAVMGDSVDVEGVLFYDVDDETRLDRLLERGKTSGRTDDNAGKPCEQHSPPLRPAPTGMPSCALCPCLCPRRPPTLPPTLPVPPAPAPAPTTAPHCADTIQKRFRVFKEETMPVVSHYDKLGRVFRIDGAPEVDQVFKATLRAVAPVVKKEAVAAAQAMLDAADSLDWEAYAALCEPDMTAVEDETHGATVCGLEFHKFYFDEGKRAAEAAKAAGKPLPARRSAMLSPTVSLQTPNVAVVSYTRAVQSLAGTANFAETRVFVAHDGVWRCAHLHRSRAGEMPAASVAPAGSSDALHTPAPISKDALDKIYEAALRPAAE